MEGGSGVTDEMTDRLALAWCRLNKGEWDEELLGAMPEGVDERTARWNAMDGIEAIIGEANTSMYWNLTEGGKTEEEWLRWYLVGKRTRPEVEREKRTFRAVICIGLATPILLTISTLLLRWWLGL